MLKPTVKILFTYLFTVFTIKFIAHMVGLDVLLIKMMSENDKISGVVLFSGTWLLIIAAIHIVHYILSKGNGDW